MRITMSTHPELYKLARHVYPEYAGRKVHVVYRDNIDCSHDSGAYGGGGSVTEYRFVRLDTGAVMPVPPVRYGEDGSNRRTEIPAGAACVVRNWFCGRDCGLTIYMPARNALSGTETD